MKRKNSKKDIVKNNKNYERKNSKNDENKNRYKDRKKKKKIIIDDFHMQMSILLNKIIFRCVVICTIDLNRFIVLIFDHKIHEKNTEE